MQAIPDEELRHGGHGALHQTGCSPLEALPASRSEALSDVAQKDAIVPGRNANFMEQMMHWP